ncbi:MAG: protein translocase subunit SecF [Candidatus Babeliaceae bacterium]|nr:protein translocase subunit SecF [Candidatus Babeliaceae bacterium]
MIDFLKYRAIYITFSALFFLSFIGAYWYKVATKPDHQAFIYSVEFTGGLEVLYSFSKPVSGEKVKEIFESHAIDGVVVRTFTNSPDVIVRVPLRSINNSIEELAATMRDVLQKEIADVTVEIQRTDAITAGVGETMRWKSMQAIAVGLVFMLLYIALRFWSFAFAAGAVFALFHDVVVILAFFLFFDFEISLNVIGAVLAVLGYSINDTIVIFSRIRENIVRLPGHTLHQIVNMSLNETLRRTLLTSFATTLVVIPLAIFGGEVLRTLSIALLIGFVFGTYSSIYIASPVMMLLYKNK